MANVQGQAPDQAPAWLTLLTSMFMHGGLLHLLGNMLFLWIFGNNIEDSMGRVRFVLFYLAGGVVALLAQTVLEPSSTAPTIGASGAVAAVLGGYALLYPRARGWSRS
jgi:membrane associated rhomboid family serine protease